MANPPSVTYPSPNEWPDTIRDISGITKAAQAKITSTAHGFTSADVDITEVGFTQIHGMIQMNGLTGLILSVDDVDHFTVNINSSNFFTYTSGGYANILTGIPPVETQGQQTFNTPFQNIA